MSIAPPVPQHLAALELANRSRLAGAAVKHDLATGEVSLAEALEDPRAGSVRIADLLAAQHQWGTYRAAKLLAELRINERKRVRDLTARQRREIADEAGR